MASSNKIDSGFSDLGKEIEIKVKFLVPGTKLISAAYDPKGTIVQQAYVPFSQEKINDLLKAGIEKIYYTKSILVEQQKKKPSLIDYVENNLYQGPRAISNITQKQAITAMANLNKNIRNLDEFDILESREVVDKIVSEIKETNEQVVNLLDIQSYDDYTYTHSLNVGVISIVFARKLGLCDETVYRTGIGAFLHDIGKVKIPYELLNKKERLSNEEFNILKKHSIYGYETAKKNPDLEKIILDMILFHHEKFNGKGYPFGLYGDQISDEISIISIADVYDALTTNRPYKKAYKTREAFQYIAKNFGKHFKPEIARRFVSDMGILFRERNFYAIDSYVLLNTFEIARVVSKDSDFTSRPNIEILINQYGKIFQKPIFVNLNLDDSRHIIRTLDYHPFISEI